MLVNEDGELVASKSCAAGALGRPGANYIGHSLQDFVADDMSVKVVDLLEEIEVEEEEPAFFDSQAGLGENPHEFAPVREAGHMVDVGVVVRGLLGKHIGGKGVFQVLRPTPGEQDDRNVQQEGDGERGIDAGSSGS